MNIAAITAALATTAGKDLSAAIEQTGYTRGLAHRGRLVLVGDDVIVVQYDNSRWTYAPVGVFASVADAESYVRSPRDGEAAALRLLRNAEQAIVSREALDAGR